MMDADWALAVIESMRGTSLCCTHHENEFEMLLDLAEAAVRWEQADDEFQASFLDACDEDSPVTVRWLAAREALRAALVALAGPPDDPDSASDPPPGE